MRLKTYIPCIFLIVVKFNHNTSLMFNHKVSNGEHKWLKRGTFFPYVRQWIFTMTKYAKHIFRSVQARQKLLGAPRCTSTNHTPQKALHTYSVGMVRMMSESPGSVMAREQTLKYLPHAVPSSMLLPE